MNNIVRIRFLHHFSCRSIHAVAVCIIFRFIILSQLLIGLCVFVAVYCHQYQQCSEYIVVTNSIVVVVVVVDEPFILLFCVYVNALKRTIHLPVFFFFFHFVLFLFQSGCKSCTHICIHTCGTIGTHCIFNSISYTESE